MFGSQETLNKNSANYYCAICDYNTSYQKDLDKHISTRKHKKREMEVNGSLLEVENSSAPEIFYCDYCQYKTKSKSDYSKHEATQKHKKKMIHASIEMTNREHICNYCEKSFANSGGLWKHKQKCKEKPEDFDEKREHMAEIERTLPLTITTEMFLEFMNHNKELQNLLVEQNAKLMEMANHHFTLNNNSNNTTNNQFNIQMFLNEKCKNALNITDFIKTVQLQLTADDFEQTGKLGYVNGISRIFINGLKNIGIENRPIHCTDLKRETIYIKHDNKWEKEDEKKQLLKWLVKSISKLNLAQLPKWQERNPYHTDVSHKQNDEYVRLSLVALGGDTPEEEDKYIDKIVKNILKEVVIDKKNAM